MNILVAVPVFNEARYVSRVLERMLEYAPNVLVIDDGSTDQTPVLLAKQPVEVIRHARNRGYGQSLIDAFRWAGCYGYDWLITMDCDEQHEPEALPTFYKAIEKAEAMDPPVDVISGSRYMDSATAVDRPPADRQNINQLITQKLNEALGLSLTDAFCGFKAYRTEAVKRLTFSVKGYAFPLQFWVRAVAEGLRITELPVRLIYNDPNRSFGGPLDDANHRLEHYLKVLNDELALHEGMLPMRTESCTAGRESG